MLNFTVTVDPSSSALAMLNTMQTKTGEAFQLRANISMRMRAAVLKNFDASGRPIPWVPRKDRFPHKLLWKTGNLVGSFHDRVQGESAEVYTQVNYAFIHQFGGTIAYSKVQSKEAKGRASRSWLVPARPFMSMLPAEEDEIATMIFDWVEGSGTGGSAIF